MRPFMRVGAEMLRDYVEHDGTINGDDYLQGMADAGIWADADNPITLLVWRESGVTVATVFDGNHRLLLALETGESVAVRVVTDEVSQMPGTPIDLDILRVNQV